MIFYNFITIIHYINESFTFTKSINLYVNDLYFFISEIYYLVILILLLIFCVIFTNIKNFKNSRYYIINNSLLNLIIFFFICFFLLNFNNINYYYTIFNNYYTNTFFILYFKYFIIILFILFIYLIKSYIKNFSNYDFEFIIILLFSIFSMFLILNSNDFLILYLAIELQSLCFYILVASKQNSSFSTESGLKYFILGSFASGLLLFGISLIYGFTGLLNFEDLNHFCISLNFVDNDNINYIQKGFLLGLSFITFSLLFKLGAVPFHMWLPDVYEGAPMIITAFLGIIPKITLLFIFVKLYFSIFFYYNFIWHNIFIYTAIFSIILGSIAAIYQIKIKRLFTYSIISNSGFFLFALSFCNIDGLQSLIFYLFIYLFTMLAIFICIISLKEVTNQVIIKKISLLINLYNINPILAISFSLLLFSIAGIPPLMGFFGKFYILLMGIKNSIFLITFLFIIFSIISMFYYIRLIKLMFFNKNKYWFLFENITKSNSIILGLFVIINMFFFINPNLILKLVHNISIIFYI